MANSVGCIDIGGLLGRAVRSYTKLVFDHFSRVSPSYPKLAVLDSWTDTPHTFQYCTHPFDASAMEESDLTAAWLDACRPKDTSLSASMNHLIGITALAFNPFWIGWKKPDEKRAATWLNGLCKLGASERLGAFLPIGTFPDTSPNTLLLCETIRNVHTFAQATAVDAFTHGTGIALCEHTAQEYHQALFNFVFLTFNLW